MMTAARTVLAIFASSTLVLCLTSSNTSAQDSTTSFDGPPKQIDENALPAGIGFNQTGGELSATALEQAAIGNPTIHYHYYGAPQPKPTNASAPTDTSPPPAPTTVPPGYAPNTYIAPITMSQNTSWHLYTGNIGGPVGGNMGNIGNMNVGGSTNFYIPNGVSGYIPSPDNVAYGSGAFVGDWDPYARGGVGTVQGFD